MPLQRILTEQKKRPIPARVERLAADAAYPSRADAMISGSTNLDHPSRDRLLLRLQEQYGNQYVQRLLNRTDPAEPEAGRQTGQHIQRAGVEAGQTQTEEVIPEVNVEDLPKAPQAGPAKARPIHDLLHLRSEVWKKSSAYNRVDAAFHNDPTLTAADNGPAVGALQLALVLVGYQMPKSTKPNGELDGQWGSETAAIVRKFQSDNGIPPGGAEAGRKTLLALDYMLEPLPTPPPKPTPPGPTPPEPTPPTPVPQDNQELETVLNVISNNYQLLLTRQRDGVLALCRDLSDLDRPEAPAGVELLKAILIGLVSFEWGFAEGAVRQAISKALKDSLSDHAERIKDIDEGFGQLASVLQQVGQAEIEKIGKPSIKNLRHLLANYCDTQLAIITAQGFRALNTFEIEEKSRLRKPATPSKHDDRNASGDPRVDVAWKTADAIDTEAKAAFDDHYQAARNQWASKLAQAHLGVDQQNIKDTNLEPLKGDKDVPAGVLDVHLFPHLDAKGEDVIGARISGLSEEVRTRLIGKRGRELHLPIVAEGPTGGRRMRIGVTESQEDIVDLTDSHSGGQWLEERGDGSRREGALRVAKTVLDSPMPEVESG